jgi:hypothetical protein
LSLGVPKGEGPGVVAMLEAEAVAMVEEVVMQVEEAVGRAIVVEIVEAVEEPIAVETAEVVEEPIIVGETVEAVEEQTAVETQEVEEPGVAIESRKDPVLTAVGAEILDFLLSRAHSHLEL